MRSISLEFEKFNEERSFIIRNKVYYESGKQDIIEVQVVCDNCYLAMDYAKEFLLSHRAYNVKSVVGQDYHSHLLLVEKEQFMSEVEKKELQEDITMELKTATLEQFDTGCDSYWTCSNCGEDYCFIEGGPEENEYRYCPHCGAKITKIIKLEDKEKEDEQE